VKVVKRKPILLKLLGGAMFLAGTPIWAVAFSALLMNAGDFFYGVSFSWELFGTAAAGLALAASGVVVRSAGGRLEETTSLVGLPAYGGGLGWLPVEP
jgi:hypothetical protein